MRQADAALTGRAGVTCLEGTTVLRVLLPRLAGCYAAAGRRPPWGEPAGRRSCMLLGRDQRGPGDRERGVADAPLAQSAERLHGKEKVYGSIP